MLCFDWITNPLVFDEGYLIVNTVLFYRIVKHEEKMRYLRHSVLI